MYKKLGKLRKLVAWCVMLFLCLLSYKMVFALDSTSISVNGTSIYTTAGGYVSGHGIAGVSFDVDTKVLTLTNATLQNIAADDDLTINLVGSSTVTSTSPDPAIGSTAGNITIKGVNGASLSVSASADDGTAIRIGSGKRLTIGDGSTGITVTIARGANVNTDDTYTVSGNTYNYADSGGPSAGDPLELSVGGTLVIDETADPQVTSASGEGWSIEQGFMGIYQMEADAGATIGYITGTGDGSISINPVEGDVSIASNAGYSINMDGNVNVMTAMGAVTGNITLAGGIYTEGEVSINDRDVVIGSSGTPSTKGIEADRISAGSGNLTIYTSATALQYYNPTPAEGEGLTVESSAGKSLTVESSNIATANVTTATVSGGGTINLTFTTSLGTFASEASNWSWSDMSGTAQENPTPTVATCSEGTDTTNKCRMTTSANNFLLESMAGTTYALSSNVPESTDSDVTNGSVNVISGNGYKRVAGSGYTDFVIEEGSQVTIELLPDYGYQYVSGGLNGSQTTAGAEKGSYTFTMPANNLHLSAIFEKSSDIINVNSSNIASATIGMPANVINGNAEFTVADAASTDKTVFEKVASGATVGGLVDLSLNEVVLKGTNDDAWKTNITELGSDMTVNLALSKNLQGHTNYTVLRDHNGTVTALDSTYNSSTGALSFATDEYSTYAIAYSDTPSNPNTYDGMMKYVIIGLISLTGLLGMAICLKKRRVNA